MGKKNEFDDLMQGLSGGFDGVKNLAFNNPPTMEITPEQREAIAKSRTLRRGRPVNGEKKEPDYKTRCFRVSLITDNKLTKIAAVSGKSFREVLEEAIDLLGNQYKL